MPADKWDGGDNLLAETLQQSVWVEWGISENSDGQAQLSALARYSLSFKKAHSSFAVI